MFDFDNDVIVYKDLATNPLLQGLSIRMKFSDTVEDLKNLITVNFIEDLPDLFETHQIVISQPLSNKCAHLLKPLDSVENFMTIKEANIWHKACLLVLPKNQAEIERILDFIGEVCEPISINCTLNGEKFVLLANKA